MLSIPLLARSFMQKFATEATKEIEGLTDQAMQAFVAFNFPGNVRELENYMERAVALVNGPIIDVADLPEEVRRSSGPPFHDLLAFPDTGVALEDTLQEIERRFIGEALERSEGVKTRAAELLGLSFRSFRYRLQKLDIADSEEREEKVS